MTQSLKIKWRIWAVFSCTFGNYLAPVLIVAHTASNVYFGDKNDRPAAQLNKQDEDYESD